MTEVKCSSLLGLKRLNESVEGFMIRTVIILVSLAAVLWAVTQHGERCVTAQETAARETLIIPYNSSYSL